MQREDLSYTGRVYYDLLKEVGYRHDKVNKRVHSHKCTEVEWQKFCKKYGYVTEENWYTDNEGHERFRAAIKFLESHYLISLRDYTVPTERHFVTHCIAIKVNVMDTETADKYIDAVESDN